MKKETPYQLLGNISREQFLAEYWQKKPLLIRNALPDYHTPIEADELAGLACEEDVESRIVLEKGGKEPWELRNGPFNEQQFTSLPASHWTLLVQEANRHIPELSELIEKFDFIPSWWFDDVMISYAPDQGSVGPHYDLYDVFLLQVEGCKEWQIDTQPVTQDNYIENLPLRIMKQFTSEQQWQLNPGDMLYLPSGVAHHGVAIGDSLTFSIGYRALAQSEMLNSFTDFTLEQLAGKYHYSEPTLALSPHPGQISSETIQQVTQLLQQIPLDEQSIANWFGRFITESRNPLPQYLPEEPVTEQQLREQLAANMPLLRSPQLRFNFYQSAGKTQLFIDGEQYDMTEPLASLAPLLCDHTQLSQAQLTPYLEEPEAVKQLLTWLANGILYFDEES